VPDQYKSLTDAAAAAKASFDKGDYAAALAAAKDLPTKATEIATAAAAKKDELMGQWNVLAKDMPILLADWQKKLDELIESKKLPKTATPERIDELKGKLAEVNTNWLRATEAFNAGDIKGALENGASVKAAVDWIQTAWDAVQPAHRAGLGRLEQRARSQHASTRHRTAAGAGRLRPGAHSHVCPGCRPGAGLAASDPGRL
jgi:hypothetical protein